jgi:hypothetical protein
VWLLGSSGIHNSAKSHSLPFGCIRLRQLFAFQIPLQEYQVALPARPAKKP